MAARPASTRVTTGGGGGRGGGGGGSTDECSADADAGGGVRIQQPLLSTRKAAALATGGGDGKIKVWTGKGANSFLNRLEHDAVPRRNNKRDGGCDASTTASVYTGGERSAGHDGAVLSVCWHPGGEMLASAGQDWAIWLWNAEGRALTCVAAHGRGTQALAFSASGECLALFGGTEFAGWSMAMSEQREVFTLCWRHPQKLVATQAEVRGGCLCARVCVCRAMRY